MKIVTWYVLKNIVFQFLVYLLVFSGLIGFTLITRAAVDTGVPVRIALAMFPYMLPEIGSYAVPVTILLAVCLFFAKMAGSNEVIALKAIGIPPWRYLLPVWIFVFILSFFVVWTNDLAASWGRRGMARVVLTGMESMVLERLSTDGKFTLPDGSLSIEARQVDASGQLIDVFVDVKGGIRGTASSAHLKIDYSTNVPVIHIELTNAELVNEAGKAFCPTTLTYDYIPRQLSDYRNNPTIAEVPGELARLENERLQYRRRIATRMTFGFITGNTGETRVHETVARRDYENGLDYRKNRLLLTAPRHWANGFACFFFVWIGAPFAIKLNRNDYVMSFFACFIPILLLYYPLMLFGFQGVKDGTLPPVFAWTGNVGLAIVGALMLQSIHKH